MTAFIIQSDWLMLLGIVAPFIVLGNLALVKNNGLLSIILLSLATAFVAEVAYAKTISANLSPGIIHMIRIGIPIMFGLMLFTGSLALKNSIPKDKEGVK